MRIAPSVSPVARADQRAIQPGCSHVLHFGMRIATRDLEYFVALVQPPPTPPDEPERQAAVDALGILDTVPEPEIDDIARLAMRVAHVPISLVSLVDRDRQWFKARCGLDMAETPRAVSFCAHAIVEPEPLIVSDALQDPRYADNPLVTGEPRIRFYAGFPVRSSGRPVGTLCVIDRVPRSLTSRQLRLLYGLARQVEMQLELRRRLAARPPRRTIELTSRPPDSADAIHFRIRVAPERQVEHLGGALERITGFRPEDFYADANAGAALIHPDDQPLLGLALASPEAFERPLALRWRTKGGRWVWLMHHLRTHVEDDRPVVVEGTAYPAPGAAPTGPTAESETPLAHALDVTTVVDAAGTIQYSSPSVKDVFGYEPSELLGTNAFELVHEDDRPRLLAELAANVGKAGSTSRVRYRSLTKSGAWMTVESVARNLIDEFAVRGILVQTRDMSSWAAVESSLLEAQEEARRLAESRMKLIDDLQRVQAAREQLSALIVHDLKSPLSAVMMNAQFVLEDAKAAGLDVSPVEDMISASESMHRMVLDILDVSRSQSDRLVPRRERVIIAQLLERARSTVSGTLQARKQSIADGSALTPADATAEVDESLMLRVVQNLLDNASKYSPPSTEIALEASISDDRLRIDVLDRGPGIPDDHKQRVFELYAQLDRDAGKHARTSRGLGLAFCKQAVSAHGGRIWIEDRPDGGSAFCVEIALRASI